MKAEKFFNQNRIDICDSKTKETIKASLLDYYQSFQSKASIQSKSNFFLRRAGLVLGSIFVITFTAVITGLINRGIKLRQDNITTISNIAIEYYDGDLEFKKDGEDWTDATLNTKIGEGDSLRIYGSGKAIIKLDDGSTIRLASDTEVEVSQIEGSNVQVSNKKGEVYARSTNDQSEIEVKVDNVSFKAANTAYKTVNTDEKKGVEVYHNEIEILGINNDNQLLVEQGNKYYIVNIDSPETENIITLVAIDDINQDEFIKWNVAQDIQDFNNQLGVLALLEENANLESDVNNGVDTHEEALISQVENPVPNPEPVLESTTPNTVEGSEDDDVPQYHIELSVSTESDGVLLNWVSTDLQNRNFLITVNRLLDGDDLEFVGGYKVSGNSGKHRLDLADGKKYQITVCALDTDDNCLVSSRVQFKAPLSRVSRIASIELEDKGRGKVEWAVEGTNAFGTAVVWSRVSNPTYPPRDVDTYRLYSSDETITSNPLVPFDGEGVYYVRVCENLVGKCGTYSNQVEVKL